MKSGKTSLKRDQLQIIVTHRNSILDSSKILRVMFHLCTYCVDWCLRDITPLSQIILPAILFGTCGENFHLLIKESVDQKVEVKP